MNCKINIGVLGCAKVADRYVMPAIIELNDKFDLIGIASRTEDKANKLALKFNCKAFSSYDELLGNSDLQAIYIPLPNKLHFDWIEKALKNGLHVLVEKSLACSYEEAILLNELARKEGLILLENFQFRFHSQLSHIISLVNDGRVGELRCIRTSFGFPPFPDADNIRYQKTLGGGALLDAGAYPIKLAQIFLGRKVKVEAANLFMDEIKGVDIWGGAYLKQENGDLFAEIAFGFDNFYQCNLEMWGSKGKIYTNRIFTAASGIRPIIEMESRDGMECIQLEEDHHFKNILVHFYKLINHEIDAEDEYDQNINQARLIAELRTKANE